MLLLVHFLKSRAWSIISHKRAKVKGLTVLCQERLLPERNSLVLASWISDFSADKIPRFLQFPPGLQSDLAGQVQASAWRKQLHRVPCRHGARLHHPTLRWQSQVRSQGEAHAHCRRSVLFFAPSEWSVSNVSKLSHCIGLFTIRRLWAFIYLFIYSREQYNYCGNY